MRVLTNLLGAIAILAGIGLAVIAFSTTSILSQAQNASAVQITQVYSEATFYAVLSGASFLFAIAMMIPGIVEAIQTNTETIQFYGDEE